MRGRENGREDLNKMRGKIKKQTPRKAELFSASQPTLAFAFVTAMAYSGRIREPQDLNCGSPKGESHAQSINCLRQVFCQVG